jgi:hypothetical protein
MRGFKSPGQAQRFLAAYGPMAKHVRSRHHRFPAPVYPARDAAGIRQLAGHHRSTCSDLISSGARLDYITDFNLDYVRIAGAVLLTLRENRLGLSDYSLITSDAARIK